MYQDDRGLDGVRGAVRHRRSRGRRAEGGDRAPCRRHAQRSASRQQAAYRREDSADSLPAEVFLEVPADDDVRRGVTAPPATTIHWLPRGSDANASTKPGSLALRAVKNARLPQGSFYTWVAGEAALATGVRRHLVGERGVSRSDISFRGYRRHGRAAL
ncbi:siderophore-interacting protein [Streptomyces sp. NPDC004629]|uniref:siderophore-interacting protein n=1 Tax=Streptomyces sp. NPDC004629 TaxID=3364705 RepID=UPI003677735B